MDKVIAFVFVLAAFVGIVLGIWWLIWLLWTTVIPQIWPSGPEAIIRPSYWLFAGLWLLLGFIGKHLRGQS